MLLALNASCEACAALGPPPSAILTLPPPPLPAFLKNADADAEAPCELQSAHGLGGLAQTCDWSGGRVGAPGVEYVELPRQVGGMGVGTDDDTWFLVLVSCSAGVLLLGAILAVVLMRCRQARGSKCVLSLDPSSLDGHGGKSSKLVGGEVLYPDPRALWAALTPSGGTQHFVGPSPPPPPAPAVPHLQLTQRHLTAPSPPPPPQQPSPTPTVEPEYAMPMTAGPPPLEPPPPPPVRVAAFSPAMTPPAHTPQTLVHGQGLGHPQTLGQSRQPAKHPRQHGHVNKMATLSHASYAATLAQSLAADTSSFDNSGFVDSDDQLLGGDLLRDHDAYASLGNSLGLGSGLGYYHTVGGNRRGHAAMGVLRPKVSSPTRIANPNLPPLNLHPTPTLSSSSSSTGTHSRRSLRRAHREAREAREARHNERHGLGLGHGDRDRERERHHASSGALAL